MTWAIKTTCYSSLCQIVCYVVLGPRNVVQHHGDALAPELELLAV